MFAIYRYALVLVVAMLALALPASVTSHNHHADQDAAIEALAAGEIMSLRAVLNSVKTDYPGRVMNVEFEREHELWVYKIRLLQAEGRLLKLKVDAKTGAVIAKKSRQRRYKGRH